MRVALACVTSRTKTCHVKRNRYTVGYVTSSPGTLVLLASSSSLTPPCWFQAVQTGNPVMIRQAQINIAQRRAGLRTPVGATPLNFATPRLAGSLLRTPAGVATPAATPARTPGPEAERYGALCCFAAVFGFKHLHREKRCAQALLCKQGIASPLSIWLGGAPVVCLLILVTISGVYAFS